uniref:Uncharacterized protein n=1 Tax=Chenopodium quinoa TaxID=63459 RepID=A0A803LFU3_CHEQI
MEPKVNDSKYEAVEPGRDKSGQPQKQELSKKVDKVAREDSSLAKNKFDPAVYVDNWKSLGGRVKEAGIVVANFELHKKHKAMNVNCPLETFGRVIRRFDKTKTRVVREMGFGTPFYIVGHGLPRTLVHWVFGTPMGDRELPKKAVLYLDRLDGTPVKWGGVAEDKSLVERRDEQSRQRRQCKDVAYGKGKHPNLAPNELPCRRRRKRYESSEDEEDFLNIDEEDLRLMRQQNVKGRRTATSDVVPCDRKKKYRLAENVGGKQAIKFKKRRNQVQPKQITKPFKEPQKITTHGNGQSDGELNEAQQFHDENDDKYQTREDEFLTRDEKEIDNDDVHAPKVQPPNDPKAHDDQAHEVHETHEEPEPQKEATPLPEKGKVLVEHVPVLVPKPEQGSPVHLEPNQVKHVHGDPQQVARDVVVEDMDPDADLDVEVDAHPDDEIDVDRLSFGMKYTFIDPEVELKPSGTKGGCLKVYMKEFYVDKFVEKTLNEASVADDRATHGLGPESRERHNYIGYSSEEDHVFPHQKLTKAQHHMVRRKTERSKKRRKLAPALLKASHSYGIHMLMAIKRNVENFLTKMGEVTNMAYEIAWLLCEDLMSEFNEARADVQELIKDLCL